MRNEANGIELLFGSGTLRQNYFLHHRTSGLRPEEFIGKNGSYLLKSPYGSALHLGFPALYCWSSE